MDVSCPYLLFILILLYIIYIFSALTKHELCSELTMHYISFILNSFTALSSACSSAFNLFLSFLFTSTYSHRCYHYFSTFIVEERTPNTHWLLIYLFVSFWLLSTFTNSYAVLCTCLTLWFTLACEVSARAHQASKSKPQRQTSTKYLFDVVVSTYTHTLLHNCFVLVFN